MTAHPLDLGPEFVRSLEDASDPSSENRPLKNGARFSLGPLRILKAWFSRHQDHPYPGSRDLDELQAMTGLSRQQITTWLSNARRRNKSRIPTRPTSPGIPTLSTVARPVDIPGHGRPHHDTSIPTDFDQMDPLQRWQQSPPEHEPASTAAILSAVSGSSGLHLPPTPTTQHSPWGEESSVSSAGTSLSNHSSAASAYSHLSGSSSRRSSDPLASQPRRSRKRRGRNINTSALKRAGAATARTTLSQAPRRYQCTFCTETFTTKHNWQRHEKTLHLSLELWECSPDGPYVVDVLGQRACAYCAQLAPDREHMRGHNYDACENRPLGERSFYRKDHLFQHLNLVHHVRFDEATMAHWRHDTGDFSSRCGFCDEALSSWSERADHIAAHFKAGQTMAEWVGDWGFEPAVIERVENAIPPYLIEYERHTPWPFTAEDHPHHSPVNAFELIKLELDYFSVNFFDLNFTLPSPTDLQYEACCVIFGADMLADASAGPPAASASWFRDVLMSSRDIARRARLTPMKTAVKYRMTDLSIIGKNNMFEGCVLEERLQSFVALSLRLGSRLEDRDLQHEACHIVEQTNTQSPHPSNPFVEFLAGLITSSTLWLAPFRRRAGLPETRGVVDPGSAEQHPVVGEHLPGDLDHGLISDLTDMGALPLIDDGVGIDLDLGASIPPAPADDAHMLDRPVKSGNMLSSLFDTTDKFYRQFIKELARFVTSTMSPRNPQCRVPSDDELQHQARWIMFESDDPWNQTPADNEAWLRQFKSEHGLHS